MEGFGGYQEYLRAARDVGELEVIQSGAEYECCFSCGYGGATQKKQEWRE